MGIILGAMAGAAKGLEEKMDSDIKFERDNAAAEHRSKLDLQRQQTMMEYQEKLRNAPMQRLTTRAQKYAGEEVPMEAAKATTLPGGGELTDPGQPVSFSGDIDGLRQSIMAEQAKTQANLREIMAAPDGPGKDAALAKLKEQKAEQDGAMAQLQRQIKEEGKRQEGIVAGKMRKRTPDEALAAAVDDAKINDLQAYSEYENKIGKPQRDDRRIDIADKRATETERRAQAGEKFKVEAEDRKDARTRESEDRKDERQAARLEALVARTNSGDKVSREERMRFTTLFSDAGRRLGEAQKTLSTLQKNPMYSTATAGSAEANEIEGVRETIRSYQDERKMYQSLLAGSQTGGAVEMPSAAPAKPPAAKAVSTLPAGAKQIGTSGGKPVYQTPDGRKFIGE